jgi:D-inositol-3-phosphate glycosyltransferase
VYTRVHDPADPRVEDLAGGVRLIHLKAGKEAKIHKMDVYFSLPEFIRNLESYWKNNRRQYDIVYAHYWLSGPVAKLLQQRWQIPFVIMFHTLGAVKNAIGIGEGEPELRIATERELVRDCQRIIVATEREKADLVHYYEALPDKVGIVPCGVNMELFQLVDKAAARKKLGLSNARVLLFVGRIDPLKGVDRLLKAMPYLKGFEGLKLIVIGGDEYSRAEVEKLQKLSEELNIQDSITFQGLIKQDQLPYFYNAADVCVVPSYYESFGLVPLESLACGTPVVATDVGDLKNIIRQGETGYVIGDNAPGNLAESITSLLSRPPRDAESTLAIRASVSRFNWANIAEDVVRELQMVLDRWMVPVA